MNLSKSALKRLRRKANAQNAAAAAAAAEEEDEDEESQAEAEAIAAPAVRLEQPAVRESHVNSTLNGHVGAAAVAAVAPPHSDVVHVAPAALQNPIGAAKHVPIEVEQPPFTPFSGAEVGFGMSSGPSASASSGSMSPVAGVDKLAYVPVRSMRSARVGIIGSGAPASEIRSSAVSSSSISSHTNGHSGPSPAGVAAVNSTTSAESLKLLSLLLDGAQPQGAVQEPVRSAPKVEASNAPRADADSKQGEGYLKSKSGIRIRLS